METEDASPCLQTGATGSFSKSAESNPQLQNWFHIKLYVIYAEGAGIATGWTTEGSELESR
jgi:hypothetical protein